MSKLIDRLESVGQSSPAPFGFGAASSADDVAPSITLIGLATETQLTKKSAVAAAAKAEAVMVDLDTGKPALAGDELPAALENRLWGVRVQGIDGEQARQLTGRGCDFVVFDADNTAAEVLNDETLGKVLAVGPDLSEDIARAIQGLPIDALLYSTNQDLLPLTVQKLIEIQMVRSLVDRPFILATPSVLGASELQSLRDAGVAGIVVEVSPSAHIAKTKEAIAALPRRKPGGTARDPVVPYATTGSAAQRQGDYDDDDDDDDPGDF